MSVFGAAASCSTAPGQRKTLRCRTSREASATRTMFARSSSCNTSMRPEMPALRSRNRFVCSRLSTNCWPKAKRISVGPRRTVPERDAPMMTNMRSTRAVASPSRHHRHSQPASLKERMVSCSRSARASSTWGGPKPGLAARQPPDPSASRLSAKNRRHCEAPSATSASKLSNQPSSRAAGAMPRAWWRATFFHNQACKEDRGPRCRSCRRTPAPSTARRHVASAASADASGG
mmetsp:Transcript_155097/g.476427  ORF Transcript_155097/g.476427 Transcript_155097/m.476427 type:complete len:233 (-) Transcript_155097:79-777(-)